MTDDEKSEILAQAIWMGQFGTITLTPEYQAWSADNKNKQQADAYRAKAKEMLGAAKGQKHHSLGWIP